MKGRILIITLLSFAAVIAVNYFIYGLLTSKTPHADVNLEARGIETPIKLILSGYLGLFFGFKYLGLVNWLVIPLFLLFIWIVKPVFSREQKAFLLLIVLSFGLIALKGYFNQRYQLTLVPLVFLFIFLFIWKIFTHLNNPFYLREITMIFILLNSAFYTYHLLYGPRVQEKIEQIFVENIPKPSIAENFKTVHELTDFVDSIEVTQAFLVNNLPDFYYHTNKKGLYYWCQDDFYYSGKGITRIFENRTDEEVLLYLKKNLNCHYIYTMEIYNKYSVRFEKFLNTYCTLIAKDRENKQLFVINND